MTYAQNMQGQGYISARGRATAIVVLVSIQLAVLVAVLGFSAASLSGSGVDLPMLTIAGGLETFEMLLFLATFIVYMTWVYRSIANLPALGSMSCRFTPGGAVWSFFIPFVNLVRGHQVMATIWQESQPPAVGEKGFYLPRSTAIVGWWWGLLLAMRILGTVVERWNPSGIRGRARDDERRHVRQWSARGHRRAVPADGAARAAAPGRAVGRPRAPAQRAAADGRRAPLSQRYGEIGPR